MQTVTIICVGKLKEIFYEQAVKEYARRISGSCRLEMEELQESRLPASPSAAEIENALAREAEQIEAHIPKGAAVIAMCVEGKTFSSEAFSNFLTDYGVKGYSRLCFVIGGSFGLSERIKKRADARISMSPMTFPHHLARVMLLEQLYRGYQIAAGTKYHK